MKVFQRIERPLEKKVPIQPPGSELPNLLHRFRDVFQDTLVARLLPERSVEHAIKFDKNANPPALLYQLSPAELMAVKEYVIRLLREGKSRRS